MRVIGLSVVVDAKTYLRLEAIVAEKFGVSDDDFAEKHRRIEELAENAISEEALGYFRDRGMKGDPA